MKKCAASGLLMCIAVCSSFFSFQPVEAHVSSVDGEITVALHIDPADNPIAGQESSLIFLFDDETNRFRTAGCDCQVTIAYAESASQSLVATALPRTGVIPFIFPVKAVYVVEIEGTPKPDFDFQPFHSTFEIRIDRDGNSTQDESLWPVIKSALRSLVGDHASHFIIAHLFHIILFGGAILVCIIIIVKDKK